jgi:dolichol-phosphate hexosyltransferase
MVANCPIPISAIMSRPSDLVRFGNHERQFVLLRAARFVRQGELDPQELASLPAQPNPEITAIIPARNEAATIVAVIEECRRYAGEVLVVEGGSTDNTAEIAVAAGATVVRDQGVGKGAALRLAVEHVKTPICVFIDADGSHDPIDIPMLVGPIKAGLAEHVGGSRLLGGSDELHGGADEFLRLAGSAFITYLINRRFGVRLSDSQNGFRAIRTDVFRRLALRSRHTTIEMEMIMATLAAGYRIAEVPTHERPRAAGFSKISLSKPGTWMSYGWTLLAGLCQRRSPKTLTAVS